MKQYSGRRIPLARTVTFSMIVALLLVARPSHAGSVFDDNWTPPTRKTPVKGSGKSLGPSPTGAAGETENAAVPTRRAIPGKLDQARSRDNLNLIFADALKDRTLAGRRKLAELLFEALPKTADNPADQYVLLGGALKAGKEGGSLRLCIQAADMLSQRFEVDDVALKADAALNMNLRGGGSADAAENAAAGAEVLDLLIADENFTAATRLSGLLRSLIPVVPSAAPAIREKIRQFEALRQEHDHFIQQLEILKTRPDDPAANLVVGEYYFLQHADWVKGLPYLARGSDADLKKAAGDELTGATTAKGNELLGDGWWAAGEKQPQSLRAPFFAHAASFYKIALANATGLGRIKMEQRISLVIPTGSDATTKPVEADARAEKPSPGVSGKGVDHRSQDAISRATMLQISHRIEAMYLRRKQGGRGGFFVGGDRGAPGHPGSKAEMDSLLGLVRSIANQTAPISAENIAQVQQAIARTRAQLDSDVLTTNPGGTGEEAVKTLKQWLDQIASQLRDG